MKMKASRIQWMAVFVTLVATGSPMSATAVATPRVCKFWADQPGNLTFSTVRKMREGMRQEVLIEIPHCDTNQSTLTFEVDDTRVSEVVEVLQLPPDEKMNRSCWAFQAVLLGKRLGMASVYFTTEIIPRNHTNVADDVIPDVHEGRIDVIVLPRKRIFTVAFRMSLFVFVLILNLGFGCRLDLDVVKNILRRPVAPATGFFCQFLGMPLLGLAISKSLNINNIFAFGLLTLSCTPGGGGSNIWTFLFHGDVNLSVTMTFFSLTCSLVMMPFWLFTLSRFYVDPSQVKIPFKNILTTLAAFVIPCFIGILIRKWKQNVATKIGRLLRPLSLLFMVLFIACMPYANLYMYTIMGQIPSLIAPAMLLPWCGFIIGFVISTLLGQPRYRAMTIAIETGIQNFTIAFVLLQQSFPQPFGHLAAVMPLINIQFMPTSLLFIYIITVIRNKCCNREKKGQTGDQQGVEDSSAEDKELSRKSQSKASIEDQDVDEPAMLESLSSDCKETVL